MKFVTNEGVKIKKIDYLGEDLEFGNNYYIVNIHLENDERVLTNVLHRTINKYVLEVLMKTNEIPLHMIESQLRRWFVVYKKRKIKDIILDYIFDKFGERFSEMNRCGYSQDDIEQKNYWRSNILK